MTSGPGPQTNAEMKTDLTDDVAPKSCQDSCQATPSIEALNRTCYCLTLDEGALRHHLEAELGARGLSEGMVDTHPHLFAAVPLFVSRIHVAQMARVIDAVENVVATSAFRRTALEWAPEIGNFDPGLRGGLLGYDFHLGLAGPQLIEINTNPGGALLNTVLARAQRTCCAETAGLAVAPMEPNEIERALFEVFLSEWKVQRGSDPLRSVAIVDELPDQQYLYPEFLLYRHLFERHGVAATICDPRALVREDGRLWHRDQAIDFVYNRLTDFALELPPHDALRLSYLGREVVLSPHPRAHALYADKRNLTLLCDGAFLHTTGVSDDVIATLLAAVPHTEVVTAGNRDAMWAKRRQLFFKPAAGYGSKAAYRGEKLTKRVWEEIAANTYVAQTLVVPSERRVKDLEAQTALKVDVRNFAYAGNVIQVAARLYQGQTTNFRTPRGGFAPVFTEAR
jgi:hypothetical protein